jgi:hypothetical protein
LRTLPSLGTKPRLFSFGGERPVVFFLLRGTSDALCRIRYGFKAGLGDLHSARLALAIAAVFDPLECCFNLVEGVLFAPQ